MSQKIIQASDIAQQAVGVPGASLQVLHKESGGGFIGLAHFAPGTTIPEHWHTHAEEMLYVLAGDLVIGDATYGPGTFFIVDPGTRHGPHSTVNGCAMLTRFSAELDFQRVGSA
jgi:quercetin dioxygenase-like cupin family protein